MKKLVRKNIIFLLLSTIIIFSECLNIYAASIPTQVAPPPTNVAPPKKQSTVKKKTSTSLVPVPTGNGKNKTIETARPMDNKPAPSRTYTATKFAENKETRKAAENGEYSKDTTSAKKANFKDFDEVVSFFLDNEKNRKKYYPNLKDSDVKK